MLFSLPFSFLLGLFMLLSRQNLLWSTFPVFFFSLVLHFFHLYPGCLIVSVFSSNSLSCFFPFLGTDVLFRKSLFYWCTLSSVVCSVQLSLSLKLFALFRICLDCAILSFHFWVLHFCFCFCFCSLLCSWWGGEGIELVEAPSSRSRCSHLNVRKCKFLLGFGWRRHLSDHWNITGLWSRLCNYQDKQITINMMPSFKLKFSLGFIASCYVICSLSMVQAMDIFTIT